ncbi:MAG: DUF4142 domain-containing protein [Chitinophagales bacterium]|nr:DUF4142 domain-containing protein [Chitinophagales bacterium]
MNSTAQISNDTMKGGQGSPSNQQMNSGQGNQGMIKFIADAMASNAEEIKLAKLGEAKSSNSELKNIAKTLVTDHTKMLNDLRNMTSGKNMMHPDIDSSKAMTDVKMLTNSKPDDFDRTWTDMMIEGHRAIINRFKSAMTEVSEQQLKSWISSGLPKIQMHLDKLTELRSKLK